MAIEVKILPDSRYQFGTADHQIVLTKSDYEDLYHAIPIDASSLYLLLNDSIIQTAEERTAFRKMVKQAGGIEKALQALQETVRALGVEKKEAEKPAEAEARPKKKKKKVVKKKLKRIKKKAKPAAAEEAPAAEKEPAAAATAATEEPGPEDSQFIALQKKLEKGKGARRGKKGPLLEKVASGYQVSFEGHEFTIEERRYCSLRAMLPRDGPGLFLTLMTKTLTEPEQKKTLRKMIAASTGGSQQFLSSLRQQIEELAPG